MKLNQPVTQVETVLPENEFIYSRTTPKGVIVEVNKVFADICAFRPEDMVGQAHNIVRHPDMPQEAYADMWRDLKQGLPWRGVIKNWRKDGGFYWVDANVTPVRENGQIVGYQSVRSRPSREEIASAEAAYRRIRAGDRSLVVEHGCIVRRRRAWVARALSLEVQLILAGVAILLPVLALLAPWAGLQLPPAVLGGVAGLCGLYGLIYLGLLAPRLLGDLRRTSAWLGKLLSSGDLRQHISLKRRDRLGEIVRQMDLFVSSTRSVLQGMQDISTQLGHATESVESGMQAVDRSAHAQSEATASAAAAIEEVTVSIGEVAANAQQTRNTAEEAASISSQGVEVTTDAREAIRKLASTVGHSAERVETLDKRSDEISRITAVIREIADQTNLLALNAAIEAARAGEQGRGFAVVADEVRKLAERTGKATGEISAMIDTIRSETAEAVSSMRSGAEQVGHGVELVDRVSESLNRIHAEMQRTSGMVSDISHASDEQQSAMTQLAQNVEQVASMTESNVAVVGQAQTSVEWLQTMTGRMQKAVQQYRI